MYFRVIGTALLLLCGSGCYRSFHGPDQRDASSVPDGGARDSGADRRITEGGPIADTTPVVDAYVPDTLQPDAFVVPDAGCPAGYTPCGGSCARLGSDFKHCGKCFNACPVGVTNACVNGSCSCGTSGQACTSSLNCIQGKCLCVKGGLCTGCCSGDASCVGTTSQSASTCGKGGAPCMVCSSADPCKAGACASGACIVSPKPDGTACEDKIACTHSDACKGGTCTGTSYSCDDNLTCTDDTCTGQAPGTCTYALKSGYCQIAKVCYPDQALNKLDTCQQCRAATSTSGWSLASGCVATLAGDGIKGLLNGAAAKARFDYPTGLVFDGSGALLVADRNNHVIRSISGGKVTTLAGTGSVGSTDGSALYAQFYSPSGLAADGTGKVVYVADRDNNKIRKLAAGMVSTLAGSGKKGLLDGAGSSAQFAFPAGVVVDASGQLVVADAFNNSLRRVTPNGVVSTLAGTTMPGLVNGPALSARFNYPTGVARDGAGGVLVVDMDNHCLRRLAGGTVSTHAGSGTAGSLNGPALSAKFHFPTGLALHGSVIYIADQTNNLIRRLAGGTVTTLAGAGTKGYKDGPAAAALFSAPFGVAVDTLGRVYVADSDNNRIRIIQP